MSEIIEKPGDFIAHGWRNLSGNDARYFGTMVAAHFDTMEEGAGNIFRAFHQAAQEKQGLKSAFYLAVKRSFEGLKPGAPSVRRRWNDIMNTLVDLGRTDTMLRECLEQQLVGGSRLTRLINHPQAGDREYQVASDILTGAGSSYLAEYVDKTLVPRIVKWHLGLFQDDFIRAAARLAELRTSPLFAIPVAQVENRAKIHVEYQPVNGTSRESLVLRFDHDHRHIEAFCLHPKGHADEVAIYNLENPHHDQIMSMVKDLSESELPHQDWVGQVAYAAYWGLHKG